MKFRNRTEAGRLLTQRLQTVIFAQLPVMLALPRGSVPVAVEVASAQHASLGLLPGACRT